MNKLIKTKIDNIPSNPGVYLMKNINNEVIYVGKAKNLKKRVPQYFLKPHEGKTQKMVNNVVDFDVIITTNEREALILEINLIHQYNPKYNILLKDDRTYPYIEICNLESTIRTNDVVVNGNGPVGETVSDKLNDFFDDFKVKFEENKAFKAATIALGSITGILLLWGMYSIFRKLFKWLRR